MFLRSITTSAKPNAKTSTSTSTTTRSTSNRGRTATTTASKKKSLEAEQQLWTSVALQQHMLRQMDIEGRLAPELPLRPRPLREGELSLAHKMGLAPMPPMPPSDEAWNALEQQCAARGDLARDCVICRMPFSVEESRTSSSESSSQKPQQQQQDKNRHRNAPVILSCGHSCFHEKCLEQLEKYARQSKTGKRCPICRSSYFKRLNASAPAVLQTHAVVRLQRVWRGFLARRAYIRLRLAKDPKFRVEHFYRKIHLSVELQLAQRAAYELEAESAVAAMDFAMELNSATKMSDEEWNVVLQQAAQREHHDCPICTEAVSLPPGQQCKPGKFVDASRDGNSVPPQSAVLCSCSHLYHASCIASMEQFCSTANGDRDNSKMSRCATCRKAYLKRFVVVV